jgi:hypothetical protein
MSPKLSVLSRAHSFSHWALKALLVTALLTPTGGTAAEGPIEPQLEVGVDRPGSDYRNFDLSRPDAKLCRASCERDQRCRAWTYVRPGHQGPKARCWLKNDVPQPISRSCCTSGFINPLHVIQACRAIGNIEGNRPVTCVDPGGRDFGKAGKTFLPGDKVMILARFRRLDPGQKEISAVYSRWQNGRFLNFAGNRKAVQFRNSSESWAFWFPAHFTDKGRWRVHVAVSGKGLTGQVLGTVEYCVGCALE